MRKYSVTDWFDPMAVLADEGHDAKLIGGHWRARRLPAYTTQNRRWDSQNRF
jgi:hypothetical protein